MPFSITLSCFFLLLNILAKDKTHCDEPVLFIEMQKHSPTRSKVEQQ